MLLTLLPGMAFAEDWNAVYAPEESASVYTRTSSPESEQFFAETAQLVADTWCDGFFGEIVFVIGEPYMWVDGVQQEIGLGATPVIIDEEILVPICVLVEETGGTILVDMDEARIAIEDDHLIEMELDADAVYIDGEAQYVDLAPVIVEDNVMISVDDVIFEELGFEVDWEPGAEQVTLTRDFQTRRLVVRTVAAKDFSALGATTILRGSEHRTILQFETRQEAQDAYDWLSGKEHVIWVEPDIFIPSTLPIDHIAEPAAFAPFRAGHRSWGVERIGADRYAAHLRDSGRNRPVVVAVIDSGVSFDTHENHVHLQKHLLDGHCNEHSNCYSTADSDGHGTHVAGIVVDSTPDLDVKILPVRALGTSLQFGNAILWATHAGADVINLSQNYRVFVHTVFDDMQYAIDRGVTVVIGAGNRSERMRLSRPFNRISVAATDSNNSPAIFTNYGELVDIAAPGVSILNRVPVGSRNDNHAPAQHQGTGFIPMSGTSQAAPHVAAAAAMYIMENPGISPAHVRAALMRYVNTPGDWNSTNYGTGILDIERARPTTRPSVNTWEGLRAAVIAAEANRRTVIPISGNLTATGEAIYIPTDRIIVLESTDAGTNRYLDMQSFSQRHFRVSGLLTLRDGITLRGDWNAGGVEVLSDAAFMMQEGSVIENCRWTISIGGGGVSVNGTNATFSLAGGTIRNNTASFGGGVAVSSAHANTTVQMSSGSIEGNAASSFGGGVFMGNSNTPRFNMTGGTIQGNTAPQGGGAYVAATAVGAFTMFGGSMTGNTARGNHLFPGNGGAIFSTRYSDGAQVLETDWSNLRIGADAVFAGNRAAFTSAPPHNAAALTHIRFAQASSQRHLLNNRDINYTVFEVPDYQITFHFDADNRGRSGYPIPVDVTPGQALSLAELAEQNVPVDHIFSTAEVPGLALWGWFRDAELTQVRQGRS